MSICAILILSSPSVAQPFNDDFNGSIAIAGPNFNVTGDNIDATTQIDEQQLENTGSTVWWFFDADQSGMVTIDTSGSDFDTQLHIFTDFEAGFANLTPVANNDDSGGTVQSQVQFYAVAGKCYEIRVGGFNGEQGNITLNGSFQLVFPDPYEAAVLSLNPQILWRLGELAGPVAENLGTLGTAADGQFGSQVAYGLPALPPCASSNAVGLIKDVESHVLLPNFLMPTMDVSISFWVQGDDNGLSHLFAYGANGATNEFTIASNNGQFRALINGGFEDYANIDVLDGQAHQVGVSRNGTTGEINIYVDGELVQTDSFPAGPLEPFGALAVGQDFDDPFPPYGFDAAQAFDGTIAEVALFHRELSAAEFESLAQRNPYEQSVIDMAPQIYWPLNEFVGAAEAVNQGVLPGGDGIFGTELSLEQGALLSGTCGRAASFVKNVESNILLDPIAIPTLDIAFSFWVEGQFDSGLAHFVAYGAPGATNEFTLASNNGSFRALINGDFEDFANINVLDAAPHHVVVNRNGTSGEVSIYIDGRRLANQIFPAGPLEPVGALALGQDFDDPNPPYGFDAAQAFDGTLDEFAMFDRLLVPEEIVILADQGELGDVNCDGSVNLLDVQPFVDAISVGTYSVKADTNGDGIVNLLDVEGFISLLSQ